MANQVNYISERQRYIPNFFNVDAAEELEPCTDRDTKLGDLLARYSVLFKQENVNSVSVDQLKLTRRGIKFYNECARVFSEDFLSNEGNNFRALIVQDYRGHRAGYDYDENMEILVFDNNGFLVAHPSASHLLNNEQKAFSIVIDNTLYIGFVHDRYDAGVSVERDTTCTQAYTGSTSFSILGIVTDKTNFAPASSLSLRKDDPSIATDYNDDCEVKEGTTAENVPGKIGLYVEDPPSSSGLARINRWLNCPEEDIGLFVTMDLNAYADNLEAAVTSAGDDPALLKNIPGLSGSGLDGLSDAAIIKNILNEIIQIIRNRSEFIFFSSIDESKYSVIKDTSYECWFDFKVESILDLDLYLIKEYRPFSFTGVTVDYKPSVLLPGSRFLAQNREKTFSCHLKIKNTGDSTYDIESIGDNNFFAESLKGLKIFEENHGLYAIPLISYNRRLTNGTNTEVSSYDKGVPCLKIKAPDVLLWIDGVKMVPYVDYRVEENLNDICSCQYIKLMRLPGTSAADTDGTDNDEDPRDDAMFPLPLPNKEYEITVIVAWPRGNFPESGNASIPEAPGLLERYIGPTADINSFSQYPVKAKARQNYIDGILETCNDKYNAAFNYSQFIKVIPVGAIPELATLMFQNGRYLCTEEYKKRVAGDRIPVFNSGYGTLQDMELHFLFDMRIPEIRKALDSLKTEEGDFDFIIKHLSDADGSNLANYNSNIMAFIESITGMEWQSDKDSCANEKFYGFNRWINTNTSLQNGALHIYLLHHGYNSNADIYLDANVETETTGFRSINADASAQSVIGEVLDTPDNND